VARPVLFDTVTLRHFAAVGRLDLCATFCTTHDSPRWAEGVQGEIRAAAATEAHCQAILAAGWLGEPASVDTKGMTELIDLHTALNEGRRPPIDHLGEAESMLIAESTDGIFATDDNAAYDFAKNRSSLGPGRVIDTVEILQVLVADGDLTPRDAADVANAMAAAGRHLRRVHLDHQPFTAAYFRL
jgi:hypothetical protein